MLDRIDALHLWLSDDCQLTIHKLGPLLGDASFRKYFRVLANFPNQSRSSFIIMDAPPPKENVKEFIKIDNLLLNMDIAVPRIIKQNSEKGFLLLEDFGDELLLNHLTEENATTYYQEAIDIILQMQHKECLLDVPAFNKKHMLEEMQLFQDWFLIKHLKIELNPQEKNLIEDAFLKIAAKIETHPQNFIHRDFHSRNLMLIPSKKLGVIDFQDAMIGPRTYDLVSLLKDCYISWPKNKQMIWVKYFQHHLNIHENFENLWQEYTLCGLQRHLKVLGIFCRIFYRDEKSRYLADLPLVWKYMIDALEELNLFPTFYTFVKDKIEPIFLTSIK